MYKWKATLSRNTRGIDCKFRREFHKMNVNINTDHVYWVINVSLGTNNFNALVWQLRKQWCYFILLHHIGGWLQDCSNSIANTLELS